VVVVGMAVYVFHGAQLQLDDARKAADKCQQQQESLSAQLQGKDTVCYILYINYSWLPIFRLSMLKKNYKIMEVMHIHLQKKQRHQVHSLGAYLILF
jgi:hypothetical protein